MSLSMGFNKAYHLISEGETTTILANFSVDFIYNITTDLLNSRYDDFNLLPKVNIVDSMEVAFKDLQNNYPSDIENIKTRRTQVYMEIIKIISRHTGVKFYYDENTDIYSLARCIFDLFISNYNNTVFTFLYNFIYDQKDILYKSLDLEKSKKSKDISTIYNKQTYNDITLAIINANLDRVLGFISGMDIPAFEILKRVYATAPTIHTLNFIINHIDMQAPLFDIMVKPILNNPVLYPILSTNIKLEIQKNSVTIVNSFTPIE